MGALWGIRAELRGSDRFDRFVAPRLTVWFFSASFYVHFPPSSVPPPALSNYPPSSSVKLSMKLTLSLVISVCVRSVRSRQQVSMAAVKRLWVARRARGPILQPPSIPLTQ